MQTRKEKVKTKMIQIPVSLSVYDQVRKKAEAEKELCLHNVKFVSTLLKG